jgi:hypothetical protein
MAEKQNLVEEAIIQMKNVEQMIAENAKGILSSTMGREISELVKESLKTEEESDIDEMQHDVTTKLSEQDDEDETDVEGLGVEDDKLAVDDMGDDSEVDFDAEMPDMDDSDVEDVTDFEVDFDDEEPIDLTQTTDDELLKVFKSMGDEDGIIITKDGDELHLVDDTDDVEYKIQLGESDEYDEFEELEMSEDMDNMKYEDYDEEEEMGFGEMGLDGDEDEEMEFSFSDEMGEGDEVDMEDELVFEIVMDDDFEDEEMGEMEMDEMDEMEMDMEDEVTTEAFKPKGVGMGKPHFSFKKTKGGFKEDKKHANPLKGTGKPKFEFTEGSAEPMVKPAKPKTAPKTKPSTKPDTKNPFKPEPGKEGAPKAKKGEAMEASRTLKSGKYWGKEGLPKPRTAPRHLRVESVDDQVELLREKNEEYRKALNVFRDKLNEVAVFNSNLAYATRLFTEHSTTKQEKINILRRFDSVETLKESKALYKTIKDELSGDNGKVVKESIENKLEKTPASGSSANLIESNIHENVQFSRIKDLMSKIIK